MSNKNLIKPSNDVELQTSQTTLNKIADDQTKIGNIMLFGFTKLDLQNKFLIEENQKLNNELELLRQSYQAVQEKLSSIIEEKEKKQERRQKYLQRSIQPKRDPITKNIYNDLKKFYKRIYTNLYF